MKKSILRIDNNKITIKEAEFKIEDIVATTGLQRAASQLVQTVKILTATAKLALKLVLSFRSLSLKKIIKNMERANKEYDIRVRVATRKISSSILEMGSESKIGTAFALSVPSAGLVNYLRTEIDNEGGLFQYLQSNDQNLLVGDLFADAYSTFDTFTDDLLHSSNRTKNKPKYDSKRQQERNIKKAQKKFLKGIRKEYGPKAEKIYKDIFNGVGSPESDIVIGILNQGNRVYGSEEARAEALDNYLKSLRESKMKTFIIREKKNKSSESGKKFALLFLYTLGMKRKSLTDIISAKSNIDSEIEKNLNQDISQYEDLLVSFLFDFFITECINEYLENKNKDFDSILESLKSNFLSSLKNKEKLIEFEKSIKTLIDKTKSIADSEMFSFFILLLEDMKKNNVANNIPNFKSFYKRLGEISNSQDKDFLELKGNVDEIIKKVAAFNIDKTKNIILDEINKQTKES